MTTTQMLILFFLVLTILLFKSFSPIRSNLSEFEKKRLINVGDKKIQEIIDRENILSFMCLLFELVSWSLFALVMFFISNDNTLLSGFLIALFVILLVIFAPRLKIFQTLANRLFDLFEKPILRFFKKRRFLLKLVAKPDTKDVNVNSTEELQYLLENLPDYIADSDSRKIISSGIIFGKTIVKEVMTPFEEVKFIEKSEFLGPLVLDELHKLGHNKLPVVYKNFDKVVGILYLDKLLSLDVKRSLTAEKIMNTRVEYIDQNKTLREALAKMLNLNLNIMIVKENGKNIGIITMRDLIEFLIGQELKVD